MPFGTVRAAIFNQDEYKRCSKEECRRFDKCVNVSSFLEFAANPLQLKRLTLNLQCDWGAEWPEIMFPGNELKSEYLVDFQTLQNIDVQSCCIEIFYLPHLPALRSLNVSYNRIRTLQGIGSSTTLEKLHAGHNELGSEQDMAAAAAECDVLKQLPSLKIVNLEANTGLDVRSICEGLFSLQSLHSLDIRNTAEEHESCAQIRELKPEIKIFVSDRPSAAVGSASAEPQAETTMTQAEKAEYDRVAIVRRLEERARLDEKLEQERSGLAFQVKEQNHQARLMRVELDRERSKVEKIAADRDKVQSDAAIKALQLQEAQSVLLQQQQQAAAEAAAAEVAEAAAQRECIICMDAFNLSKGIECHSVAKCFICDGCFGRHAAEQSTTEAMDLLSERQGYVFCPNRKDGCEGAPHFTNLEVARHVGEEVYDQYTGGQKKLLESKLAKEISAEERLKMECELERLTQMSEEQRKVERERRLVEELLNPHCPKCKMVFVDFRNCAALTCGAPHCGAHFCAWCQEECGDDAHGHVARCPVKPPGADTFYDTKDEFMAVQRQRQRELICAHIEGLADAVRASVAEACRAALDAVGLGNIVVRYL